MMAQCLPWERYFGFEAKIIYFCLENLAQDIGPLNNAPPPTLCILAKYKSGYEK